LGGDEPMSSASTMIQIRVRFVVEDVDRHGNIRTYFRRKGCRKVRMQARPGTPEFFEEYQRLLVQSDAGKLKFELRDVPKTGTFRSLCDQYLRSEEFRELDPRTQRVRRQTIDHICAEPIKPGSDLTFRDCPLSRFGAKAVSVLRV
jgi:hypothetical protein